KDPAHIRKIKIAIQVLTGPGRLRQLFGDNYKCALFRGSCLLEMSTILSVEVHKHKDLFCLHSAKLRWDFTRMKFHRKIDHNG
ncbi:MAG: hypothetical protein WCJ75_16795, partial [Desulfomonile sp.]